MSSDDEPSSSSTPISSLYHERQRWSLCGVHAVNNLLQSRCFTKSDFDVVSERLAPEASKLWNPHRSALGLGNYDANILLAVLQERGYTVTWHDDRKPLTTQVLEGCSDASYRLVGLLVNVPSNHLWGRITNGRHWLAILWTNNGNEVWVNLDSDLTVPTRLGGTPECVAYLSEQRRAKHCHILIVQRRHGKTEDDQDPS